MVQSSADDRPAEKLTRPVVSTAVSEAIVARLRPFDENSHVVDGGGGSTIHAYDWGGEGPVLVMSHATGLHAHVWLPLVAHLRSSFRCVGVDLMAQGASTGRTDGNLHWEGVTDGMVAVLDALGLSGAGEAFAVGHSQGGYAVLSAELRRPRTFRAVFAYEPVVFPPMPGMAPGDVWPDNPMAVLTRRRRRTFVSADAAIANFASKPPFGRCDRSVVESYVHWGFRETGNLSETGEHEIELLCSPETEAGLFQGSVTDIFSRLPELTTRVIYGLGEEPGTFIDVVPRAHEATPGSTLLRFPGRTHFGVLEGVEEMAVVVRDSLLASQ
jgi:pimeloyl-ACP methyl ester carboxylesterase